MGKLRLQGEVELGYGLFDGGRGCPRPSALVLLGQGLWPGLLQADFLQAARERPLEGRMLFP